MYFCVQHHQQAGVARHVVLVIQGHQEGGAVVLQLLHQHVPGPGGGEADPFQLRHLVQMVPGHGDDAHVHLFSHGSLSSRFPASPPMVRAYSPPPRRTAAPPATVSQPGRSPKSRSPQTEANTGSISLTVAMKAGGRYFSPQLNTLCPSRVQHTAMPRAVSPFTGP